MVRAGALFLTLWLPSVPLLLKYLHPGLVAVHGALTLAAALAWLRGWPNCHRARDRALAALLSGTIAATFAIVYPLADEGRFGEGSDRDDALEQAGGALLAGRYPYYERTYLANPVTPLPGALVLALPFLLADAVPLQSLFWLGAWCVILARRGALLAPLGLATLGCVAVSHDVVTGGDLVANAVYVLVAVLAVAEAPERLRWLAYLFAGLALSSRPSFWLVLPALAVHLARRGRGPVEALAAIGLSSAAITLPFFLWDPGGFTPFHVAGKLGGAGALVRGGERALVLAAVTLVVVSSRAVDETPSSLARALAFALWLPPVLASGAAWLASDPRWPELLYFALPAALYALCAGPVRSERAS